MENNKNDYWDIDDLRIPVIFKYTHRRQGVGFVFQPEHIEVRMPKIPNSKLAPLLSETKSYFKKNYTSSHPYLQKYKNISSELNYSTLTLYDRNIPIDFFNNTKDDVIRTKYNHVSQQLNISIPNYPQDFKKNLDVVKVLIHKHIATLYLDQIKENLHQFNQEYFRKKLDNVILKYNKSSWGHCRKTPLSNSITISTKLMFYPKLTQNYVFIHELAHLVEMNHSPKFWNIVQDIMPDYGNHIQILKNHIINPYL